MAMENVELFKNSSKQNQSSIIGHSGTKREVYCSNAWSR